MTISVNLRFQTPFGSGNLFWFASVVFAAARLLAECRPERWVTATGRRRYRSSPAQPPRPDRAFRSLGAMRHSLFLLRSDLPGVDAGLGGAGPVIDPGGVNSETTSWIWRPPLLITRAVGIDRISPSLLPWRREVGSRDVDALVITLREMPVSVVDPDLREDRRRAIWRPVWVSKGDPLPLMPGRVAFRSGV
jgi:hypothetical protein